jgi:crotonobetainyl-CoA:carnitine CoA-transferase CaiB-like acyl-CoA transferase
MENSKCPLSGIRVIDLTSMAAGPVCARLLADWGADVIKIEPFEGDFFRKFGPILGMPASEEENPLWEQANANKRCIALDLKSPKGEEIIHKLLAKADVLVSNYRPHALRKLKLTYGDLSEKYPKLVYAVLTGFGEKGPEAEKAGFDVIAYWARSGAMVDLVDPSGYPMNSPAGFGDHPTGSALAAGICAALVKQQKTGRGDKVSISLLGNVLWNAAMMIAGAQKKYGYKYPRERFTPVTPLVLAYRCKDGEWIMLSILEHERYWPAFCNSIGREDLISDDRFNTLDSVKKHSSLLIPMLEEIIAKKTRPEWVEIWQKADLAFDILRHFKDAEYDEMAWANDNIYEHTYVNNEKSILIRTPVQFCEMGVPQVKRAGLLGQNTKEILTELGYSPAQITEFENKGVIKMRVA